MPRGDMTGPFGEGPFTGRRGGNLSPRERFGPGWRWFMTGGSGLGPMFGPSSPGIRRTFGGRFGRGIYGRYNPWR